MSTLHVWPEREDASACVAESSDARHVRQPLRRPLCAEIATREGAIRARSEHLEGLVALICESGARAHPGHSGERKVRAIVRGHPLGVARVEVGRFADSTSATMASVRGAAGPTADRRECRAARRDDAYAGLGLVRAQPRAHDLAELGAVRRLRDREVLRLDPASEHFQQVGPGRKSPVDRPLRDIGDLGELSRYRDVLEGALAQQQCGAREDRRAECLQPRPSQHPSPSAGRDRAPPTPAGGRTGRIRPASRAREETNCTSPRGPGSAEAGVSGRSKVYPVTWQRSRSPEGLPSPSRNWGRDAVRGTSEVVPTAREDRHQGCRDCGDRDRDQDRERLRSGPNVREARRRSRDATRPRRARPDSPVRAASRDGTRGSAAKGGAGAC